MNKQGAKGIGWADYTFNPLTGCEHACPYCYARIIAERFGDFRPRFHPEHLDEPRKLKKPARVFVGSMTDMMGRFHRESDVKRVIEVCRECPQHTFLWLTKRPERYSLRCWPEWPRNCWLGATATTALEAHTEAFHLRQAEAAVRFLSLEPWLERQYNRFGAKDIDWIIIGPMTGKAAHQPPEAAVRGILDMADQEAIAVYMKRALQWEPRREQFPPQPPA